MTGSCFAKLVQTGVVSLADPFERHLPEFRGKKLGSRTLEEILSHCAGLIGWLPLYTETDRENLPGWLLANADRICESAPRTKAVYSDLGFLLLGLVLEQKAGGVKTAFEKLVAGPTGLTETFFGPVPDKSDCAATEYCLYRKRLVQREVFDENCYALGGVAGHAGLFSTARGLAAWCREWLKAVKGESGWLGADIARRFTRPAGLVAESTWALGWDTKSKIASTAGEQFSMSSFGHLGFPGCSVWLDPVAEGFAIFFSNRIHPSRWDERIRKIRPRLHDLIAEQWKE